MPPFNFEPEEHMMNSNCFCQLFDNNWVWLIVLAAILICCCNG